MFVEVEFLLFSALVITLVAEVIGYFIGYKTGKTDEQRFAIRCGVAEYIVNSKGKLVCVYHIRQGPEAGDQGRS
jgi:hypothetical protein